MKVFEKNSENFEEVDYEVLEAGLEDGSIEVEVITPEVTSEQVFNQLKEQGVEVEVHNGVFCKVIKDQYGTSYEAVNAIPAEIKYVRK